MYPPNAHLYKHLPKVKEAQQEAAQGTQKTDTKIEHPAERKPAVVRHINPIT